MKNFRNEFFYSRISKRNNSKYSLRSLQFSIGKESTMNSKQNFFVTENPKRLRDSLIWDLQKNFYVEKGPSCWTEGIVPNFVTSNSFIAKQYATCILGYLRDYYLKYGFRSFRLSAGRMQTTTSPSTFSRSDLDTESSVSSSSSIFLV